MEGQDPPHATIFHKWRAWRVNLRNGELMDRGDSWTQVDTTVRSAVFENWTLHETLGVERSKRSRLVSG